MRIVRTLTIVAAAILFNACDGAAPTAPINRIALMPSADAETGPLGAFVVRGEVSTPSGAGLRVLTVDALQTPSGQVTGTYRVSFTATGLFFEVTVSCISIVGNSAFIGGHFTDSNIPIIQLGSVSYMYLDDNGTPLPEHQVPADVISNARINDQQGEDIRFCTERPRHLPLLTGLTGDISIR